MSLEDKEGSQFDHDHLNKDLFVGSSSKQIPTPPGYRQDQRGQTGQAGPSRGSQSRVDRQALEDELNTIHVNELIKEAERLKADIIRPPGNINIQLSNHTYSGCDNAFFQSIVHVDKATRDKIKRGESVDLVKLLSRNKYKS